VIALNVIEDFLAGEGHRFLRLVRRGIPKISVFNDSYFCFRMATRKAKTARRVWTSSTERARMCSSTCSRPALAYAFSQVIWFTFLSSTFYRAWV
jgi:hypothetical protein